MLRTIPRKVALAGFVALGLVDLQLYAHRFHPPTEMLGRYLRQLVVPGEPADPAAGRDAGSPEVPSRMEALVLNGDPLLSPKKRPHTTSMRTQ
jgi:hypothetical protein